MTKEKFIKRCETIYGLGLATEENFQILYAWADAIMRLEGGQVKTFLETLSAEAIRTNGFTKVLANDINGYKCIHMVSILNHPCQKCAEDTQVWHTRTAFCKHKKNGKQK